MILVQEAMRAPDRVSADFEDGVGEALRRRREAVVPVDAPLALISQAQRSGGTLLARLFDGHPQCHVHPHELHIGHPRPHHWPRLRLDQPPEDWYATLEEGFVRTMFGKGRRAVPLKKQATRPGEVYYPFLLPPAFQRRLFLDQVERRSPIASEREILDCYMTSLFNAWLDNQNLRGPEKRWVVAFSPRRAWGDGLDRLFELYPDGRLISILRDPMSWYASALTRASGSEPEDLVNIWRRSVAEMLEARRRYPEALAMVRFEELVLDPSTAMRRLAGFLAIDFDPRLTTPTFNGHPSGPNSSYELPSIGLLTDPVERYKEVLSEEQQDYVRRECDGVYREALAEVA